MNSWKYTYIYAHVDTHTLTHFPNPSHLDLVWDFYLTALSSEASSSKTTFLPEPEQPQKCKTQSFRNHILEDLCRHNYFLLWYSQFDAIYWIKQNERKTLISSLKQKIFLFPAHWESINSRYFFFSNLKFFSTFTVNIFTLSRGHVFNQEHSI